MTHPIIPIHSVTKLQTFEQCPRKYYATYVSGVSQGQTEEMRWGNIVHKALENNVKYDRPLPEGMEMFAWATAPFRALKAQGHVVHAEQNMAITATYEPVDYWDKTGKVWFRGKTDADAVVGNHAMIGDYKTGKPKDDPTQLDSMAMLTFALNPLIEKITAFFIWLKFNKAGTKVVYNRERDYDRVLHDIHPRIDRLEFEFRKMKFEPMPGPLCAWCHLKQCEYWQQGPSNG